MSDIRRLRLTDKVGYVDTSLLPPEGGCNILFLSDRQVHIILEHVFPYASWDSRIVQPLVGDWYQTDPTSFDAVRAELQDLDQQLNGGDTMACETVAAALAELALAIAEAGAGGGEPCSQIVHCGGGPIGGVAGELAKLSNEELLPPAPVEEPTEPTPPAGFEDWEEYQIYKCQAAHYLWNQANNLCGPLRLFAGLQIAADVAAPFIAGGLGAWEIALTPAGFAVFITAFLGICAVNVWAISSIDQWQTWWNDNKDAIVCSLYESGTAATALTALTSAIEDGLQAIVWAGLLEGLAGAAMPLLAELFGTLQTNAFVSPLFRFVAAVNYPDATCCYDTALLKTAQVSPFDRLLVGDSVSSGDTSVGYGYKCVGGSSRWFLFTPAETRTTHTLNVEFYHTETGAVVVDYQVKVHSTSALVHDYAPPNANGGWQTLEHSDSYTLTQGVQYRFEIMGVNGRTTWNRAIRLT